jgi:Bacteriophage probable baseplate hub protein
MALPEMTPQSMLPAFNLRLKGTRLPLTAQQDVRAVTVYDDINAASMCTIELYNWDMDRQQITWSDDSLFAVGGEIEIRMGYADSTQKVFTGEITGLEPAFQAGEPPTLTVRGYDHRHRLTRGSKTRSFTKLTDSAIASQIASAAGLTARAHDTKITHEYVLQHNQTDLEFLQARAARIGYEVYVRDKILYFRPPQNAGQQTLTLSLGNDIIEFYPRLTTMGQVSEVFRRGWDIKKKAVVVGMATRSEITTMGGTTSGPHVANNAFGITRAVAVRTPVASQDEAKAMARGQFNTLALDYITGDGMCYGQPDLRAGMLAQIEGAGRKFSGLYYIVSATHTFRQDQGYRTRFTYQRNATP